MIPFPALLPTPWPDDVEGTLQREQLSNPQPILVLDDDPTGTQTSHDVPVLLDPTSVPALTRTLRQGTPVSFLLTNSRSLPQQEARELGARVITAIQEASHATQVTPCLLSRSDSTLRGHFPLEVELARTLTPGAATLVVPALLEAGRVTLDDHHYVKEGERLVPVSHTEFARDPDFSYTTAHLPSWIEEKTNGEVSTGDVACISLELIRGGGPGAVQSLLEQLKPNSFAVVNAVVEQDLNVVALAMQRAQAAGHPLLARCAASFVRARAALNSRPLLSCEAVTELLAHQGQGGLIVVGSHTEKTTRQLARLRESFPFPTFELPIDPQTGVLDADKGPELAQSVTRYLHAGQSVVVSTPRKRLDSQRPYQELAQQVSSALCQLVKNVSVTPSYTIAKGGVTSSDVATRGFNGEQAWVEGQVAQAVACWSLSRRDNPDRLCYVVFPGNVGGDDTLSEVVRLLEQARRQRSASE